MVIRPIFPKIKIVLVSASPRRAQLLKQLGFQFSVYHPRVREFRFAGGFSKKELIQNVLKKIKAYPPKLRQGQVLLAADTVVVIGRKVLGKPQSMAQARKFISQLSGKTHWVHTALAVWDLKQGKPHIRVVSTAVSFEKMNPSEIRAYVATGEGLDKAGAYGIQGRGGVFVKSIRGSYSNVVGLPLETLYIMLKRLR